MMSIIGIILFSYRRHKTLTYRQLQLSKDDLRHRLEALASLKDRLTENEQNTLEAISNEIETINISSQSLRANNELFANLSARIARLNRDTALQMVKFLNEQIDRIHQYEVYECSQMIHDSEEARSTDNIEIIIEQCKKNEVWLNHIQEIKERLDKFYRSTEGHARPQRTERWHERKAATYTRSNQTSDDSRGLSRLYRDQGTIRNIFTPKGLKVICDYISACIVQLQRLKGYEEMAEAY